MPIDVAAALAAPPTVRRIRWTERDVLLYHLSLGAGRDQRRWPALTRTYERDLDVVPTFAMVAGKGISAGAGDAAPALRMPGVDVDLRTLLHGGQSLTVHRPIPAAAEAELSTRVVEVWDKGRAAVVVLEHTAHDLDGQPLWTSRMQVWARGAGGFGGDPGPQGQANVPDRAPDHVLERPTGRDQAMLYRLNGDMNPLHVDPEVARRAGFEAPLLHGLAAYGIVAAALVDDLCDGDASRLASLEVRFAGILVPGETLRIELWRAPADEGVADQGDVVLRATCPERNGAPVLTHGRVRLRS